MTVEETLLRLVIEEPSTYHTGCWSWPGRESFGYGRVEMDGRVLMVHRVVYERLRGPIPDGLCLDHLCRNRYCANPDHLEPVTQRENTLRGVGVTARNARKTHCLNGHEFDYISPKRGGRRCLTCNKAYEKKKHPGIHCGKKTHCPRGHEYAGHNLIVNSKGGRECRTCQRDRSTRRRAEEKARQLMESAAAGEAE